MDSLQASVLQTATTNFRTGYLVLDMITGAIVASIVMLFMQKVSIVPQLIHEWFRRFIHVSRKYKFRRTIRVEQLQVRDLKCGSGMLDVYGDNGIIINGIITALTECGAVNSSEEHEVINIPNACRDISTRDMHLNSSVMLFPRKKIEYQGMLFELSRSAHMNSKDKEPSVETTVQINIWTNNQEETNKFIAQCKLEEINRRYPRPVDNRPQYFWYINSAPDQKDSKKYVFSRYPWSSFKTFDSLFFNRADEVVELLRHFMNKSGPWDPKRQRAYVCRIFAYGPPGTGKCLAKGTPVIMYDGKVIPVEKIRTGDKLMGDGNTARTVMSVTSGRDTMYRIVQGKGDSYVVNSVHVLSLKLSIAFIEKYKQKEGRFKLYWFENFEMKQKSFTISQFDSEVAARDAMRVFRNNLETNGIANQKGDICDIPLDQYLAKSVEWKHAFKGFKRPVVDWWTEKKQQMDPYMLGYWIGDGTSADSAITSQDSTVLKYFAYNIPEMGKMWLQHQDRYTYRITTGVKGGFNVFLEILRYYDVLNNKHVPADYKYASVNQRLQLLAGFLDADGHLSSNNNFEFSQKNRTIFEDIVFIARSLGFMVQEGKPKVVKGVTYYRANIWGEINTIPTKIPRKRALPYNHNKDPSVYEIKVVKLDEQEYFGFTLDGNGRFCLGDFTVTHNTSLAKAIANLTGRDIVKLSVKRIRNDEDLINIVSNPYVEYYMRSNDCYNDILPLNKRLYILEDLDCDDCEHIIAPRDAEKPATALVQQAPIIVVDSESTSKMDFQKQKKSEISLSGFLNALDGLYELSGAMFFISTNHIERFDPAIYRPGRMDIKIELAYMSSDNVTKYLKWYYGVAQLPEKPDGRIQDLFSTKKLTPSRVEQVCQACKTVEQAVDELLKSP